MTPSSAPFLQGASPTGQPRWTRGDVFRAALFGALGVFYAVLLLPLAVVTAAFWLVGKALDGGSARPGEGDAAS